MTLMEGRRRIGPIERSARAYMRSLSKRDELVKTYTEMVLRLARSYDAYDGADLAKVARLNMELRQTLTTISEAARADDDSGQSVASVPEWSEVPTTVRNATQS